MESAVNQGSPKPRGGVGSFFQAPESNEFRNSEQGIDANWTLFSNGRSALNALLMALEITGELRPDKGASLWLPDYYCQSVSHFLKDRVPLRKYRSNPIHQTLPASIGPDDFVLLTSYFGGPPPRDSTMHQHILLDVSHDPWAPWVSNYPALHKWGSLRKTLPISEGGFVDSCNSAVREALASLDLPTNTGLANDQWAVMKRKGEWIANPRDKDKSWYLQWRANERRQAQAPTAFATALTRDRLRELPVAAMREARIRNINALVANLGGGLQVLDSSFGVHIVLDSIAIANQLFADLLDAEIWPARLWELPEEDSIACGLLDRRLISISTDYRYSTSTMEHIAAVIQRHNK